MKSKGIAGIVLACLCLFAWAASAAEFPQRPIRMIIPWSAGGGSDVLCRAFQPAFEKELGQRLLIENIPAGSTKIGTMEMMKAKPDGYTLLFSNEAWIPRYYAKVYETKVWEQMTPVGTINSEPLAFLEVRAESPYKTWADFVKAAKENPGKLSIGNPGVGSPLDVVFKEMTEKSGINVRYVPFAGAGPTKIAMLGGHVDGRLCQPPEAIAMVRAGKSRGLAVSTTERMKAMPDVPTFKELGLISGDLYTLLRGVWGPPKMPSALLNRITKMVEKASQDPSFKKIAEEEFIYTVEYRNPEQVRAFLTKFDKEFGPRLAEANK
ncbi:MAG TPA: tripartite tricarboxylate transporter substrate binding protein [Thermodesulfobacteriota bacterium]|nr:tripartite tricarboxylate transporter substrate binding protein [Thermodesulfobacteriota bacterium]